MKTPYTFLVFPKTGPAQSLPGKANRLLTSKLMSKTLTEAKGSFVLAIMYRGPRTVELMIYREPKYVHWEDL